MIDPSMRQSSTTLFKTTKQAYPSEIGQYSLNRIWALLILRGLYRSGVRHICIAPGSRSTPLTLAAVQLSQEQKDLCLHTHFDERGLGYLALGLSKGSPALKEKIAIIVTSGTAVANVLPAFVEANLTQGSLILLSADRPVELIGCGANQAINQKQLFGSHANYFIDLPSPSKRISPAWLLSVLDEVLAKQTREKGTVHINCPFPEPLYGELEDTSVYLAPLKEWSNKKAPYLNIVYPDLDITAFFPDWSLLCAQKGLLLVGQVEGKARHAIEALAKRLGWPILVDPQGGMGSDYSAYDLWLHNEKAVNILSKAQCTIQFGARFVSKRLGDFLQKFEGSYYLVSSEEGRLDPYHLSAKRIIAPCDQVAIYLEQKTALLLADLNRKDLILNNGWADKLKPFSQILLSRSQQDMAKRSFASEVGLATSLADILPPNSDFFIGNSMAIRLIDMCSQLPDLAVFTNRGASGIDGLIATAVGVQRSRKRTLFCLLGDTSALYDLNSLPLLASVDFPFILLIVNNNGGGIFDLLPIPEQNKKAFYQMPHGLEFSAAAELFGLNYSKAKTHEEVEKAIKKAAQVELATVIEMTVAEGQAQQDIKTLIKIAKDIHLSVKEVGTKN